jgi:hypothetical protein
VNARPPNCLVAIARLQTTPTPTADGKSERQKFVLRVGHDGLVSFVDGALMETVN